MITTTTTTIITMMIIIIVIIIIIIIIIKGIYITIHFISKVPSWHLRSTNYTISGVAVI